MDGTVEMIGVGERLMSREVTLQITPGSLKSFSSGAYFGNHSTVNQGRAAKAACEALLV